MREWGLLTAEVASLITPSSVTLMGHYSGGRKAKREIFAGIASVARILGSGKRSGVPP
ncbi:UNVERIFIED_ORG: hypothetical protein ABIB19_002522 [Arthrobacter sp. UYEF10]